MRVLLVVFIKGVMYRNKTKGVVTSGKDLLELSLNSSTSKRLGCRIHLALFLVGKQ